MSTWRKKIENARFHSVISMDTKEQRFEVSCRDRTGQGVRRQRVIQEVLITINERVFCRCQKPKVHHLPCSHVIAAFCIWVRCCVICFSIFYKRSRSTDLVSWDIWHRYSRPIHSKKSPSNAHPWCSYEAGHRPTADTSYLKQNGRVRGWKEEKTL